MRCYRIKMVTNDLGFASPCALRLTLSFVLANIATNVKAGPRDLSDHRINSRQFHENLSDSEHRNNTSWLPDFEWTPLKRSTPPQRKRPKWETGESRDTNRLKDRTNEKSEWQKQMEEISLKEREIWKKYRTEKSKSLATREKQRTLMENGDNMFRKQFNVPSYVDKSNNTESKMSGFKEPEKTSSRGKDDSQQFKEIISDDKISDEDDKGEDFSLSTETQNGRWGMINKQKPNSKNSSEKFTEVKTVEKPATTEAKLNGSKIPNDLSKGMKSFERNKKVSELDDRELGNKVESRLKGVKNGRWGMSGGNEPPSEVREEMFRRKIMEKNDERNLEKFSKETTEESNKSETKSGKDIWNLRWGMSESEPPEKFLQDITSNKNIAEKENVKKHSGRLKSVHEISRARKNLVPSPKNEYWTNDGPKPRDDDILENTRRTFDRQTLPADSERNDENLRGTGSPASIRKLIQIIITPYAAAGHGMELSIDRLIPESNGVSGMTEHRPIVIGLSERVCDKRR